MMAEPQKPIDNNTCTCPLNKRVTDETGEVICSVCGQVVCMASESVEVYSYVSKKDDDGKTTVHNSNSHGILGGERISTKRKGKDDALNDDLDLMYMHIEKRLGGNTLERIKARVRGLATTYFWTINKSSESPIGIVESCRLDLIKQAHRLEKVPYISNLKKPKNVTRVTKFDDHRRRKRGTQRERRMVLSAINVVEKEMRVNQ